MIHYHNGCKRKKNPSKQPRKRRNKRRDSSKGKGNKHSFEGSFSCRTSTSYRIELLVTKKNSIDSFCRRLNLSGPENQNQNKTK